MVETPVLKTDVPESVSGVRIPPSPPYNLGCRENRRPIALKIARSGRNSEPCPHKPDRKSDLLNTNPQVLWPFSPKGTKAVRFERLHQANTKRSLTDD